MDEKELKKKMKEMNLQKGHYYIILSDLDEDKFNMIAYDTTGNTYDSESDHTVGSITHEGLNMQPKDCLMRCMMILVKK